MSINKKKFKKILTKKKEILTDDQYCAQLKISAHRWK